MRGTIVLLFRLLLWLSLALHVDAGNGCSRDDLDGQEKQVENISPLSHVVEVVLRDLVLFDAIHGLLVGDGVRHL